MGKSNKMIGFIGTGIMGKPMAKNLLSSGYDIMAYNRSPQSLEELKKSGAVIGDIKKISETCSIIITMLPDSPQSEEVIISEKGIIYFAKPGTIVVDMSSIDPIVSIKIGKMLAEKGIDIDIKWYLHTTEVCLWALLLEE